MTAAHVIRAAVLLFSLLGDCATAQSLFSLGALPGATTDSIVPTIQRPAVFSPLRYRVIVIPGSGCSGMAPVADRYFAGLLHAEVLVLHKPGTDVNAGLSPLTCSAEFERQDALSLWLEHARAALRADALARNRVGSLPQLLVGISEGAEIAALLADEVPNLAAVVLISSSGLDPVEAGALQAKRIGHLAEWKSVEEAQLSERPDDDRMQGRTLRYWRDLWWWRVEKTLIAAPWPLVQIWGEADALVPPEAYSQFAMRAENRKADWCAIRLKDADHGLQSAAENGVQKLWGWLENWARQLDSRVCGHMPNPAKTLESEFQLQSNR